MKELIENRIKVYLNPPQDRRLYVRASDPKYWDGKINAVSLSRALRLCLNDMTREEKDELVDPFESLVDCGKYKGPKQCGQVWNPERNAYEDTPEWKASAEAKKKAVPRK